LSDVSWVRITQKLGLCCNEANGGQL
jgi:hypothetical protein